MRDQANNLSKLRRKITTILVPVSRDDSEIAAGNLPALIKSLSPIRLLAILTITIFIVELAIMVGIEFVIDPESSLRFQVVEAVFDATTLTIIVFPMLYRFSFRPLVLYITDHQRIEAALKASNALLENTFASLSDVVLVVSMPDRTVITCNSVAPTVLGYETAELVGKGIDLLYENQADYRAFLDAVTDTVQTGRFFQNECQLRRKDGRRLSAEVTVTQINNDTGDVVSQVIVIRDITRRKQDKAQLERHNQELLTLSRLGQAVVSSLELEAVLTHVIDQVMPFLKAECL